MARVLANELRRGDKIVVNIAAIEGGPRGGSRLPIGATFNHLGQRLGPDGQVMEAALGLVVDRPTARPPQFQLDAYNAALGAGDRAAADRITRAYEAELEGHRQGGNRDFAELVADAVIAWAKEGLNVSDDPSTTGPTIRRDHISVRPTYRLDDAPCTFVVQMNPVWGS